MKHNLRCLEWRNFEWKKWKKASFAYTTARRSLASLTSCDHFWALSFLCTLFLSLLFPHSFSPLSLYYFSFLLSAFYILFLSVFLGSSNLTCSLWIYRSCNYPLRGRSHANEASTNEGNDKIARKGNWAKR